MQVGDYIFGVETNSTTGKVTVNKAMISAITPKTVRTNVYGRGFGLECRIKHAITDVYASEGAALMAYRNKVVGVLLSLKRGLDMNNVTLVSIDRRLQEVSH